MQGGKVRMVHFHLAKKPLLFPNFYRKNRTSKTDVRFFLSASFQSRFSVVYCCQDKLERGIVCTRRNAEKRF